MENKDVKMPEENISSEDTVVDGVTITQNSGVQDKKKGKGGKIALKIVIWVVVIAAVIFLTLFLASKIANFESIGDMIDWIKEQI